MKINYTFMILVYVSILAAIACAKEQQVIAVVNDVPITTHYLARRVHLIMKLNGLPETEQLKEMLKKQVLQAIIDEQLIMNVAKKLEINIDNDSIKAAIVNIAAQNNLSLEQFFAYLKGHGIKQDDFKALISGQVLWSKVVKQEVEPWVFVADKEISEYASTIATIQNNNVYDLRFKLAEIVLYKNSNNTQTVMQLMHTLINKLNKGVDFSSIAREFSQSSSSATGGVVGWVYLSQLSSEVAGVIKLLLEGQLSKPIQDENSIKIFKVLKREELGRQHKSLTKSEVRDAARSYLYYHKFNLMIKNYLVKMREKAIVTYPTMLNG